MTATWRNDDCDDPRIVRRCIMPMPDLNALTPVVRPSHYECVLWRMASFYGTVRDHLRREHYPHPSGVWLHPTDWVRLRRWVEAPLRTAPTSRQGRMPRFWTDKGPARSELVVRGEIIIAARAYEGVSVP